MIRKANSTKAKEAKETHSLYIYFLKGNNYIQWSANSHSINSGNSGNSGKCILTNQKTACSNPVRVQNSLRFALYLTVSEIMTNLY